MKKENSKLLTFMRRNAIYLILTACIIAVGLSIAFMMYRQANGITDSGSQKPPVIEKPDQTDDNNDDSATTQPDNNQPVQKPVVFVMPVENFNSIAEYSDSLVWCSTLGRFQAHKAVDFFAQEGSDVFAVYDGVVESVTSSLLQGVSVTLDHGNGLKTVYNSLADGDLVVEGQTVSAGDVIGQVSVTNRQEYKEGAHLHFEVIENGVSIDPIKYLAFEEK